ncbi:MAG TPA: hypothetical protein VFX85_01310, partial [Solirubrobacterales bacterium]|nr:hypothetical protein [Solirubrobacterales bacterium]
MTSKRSSSPRRLRSLLLVSACLAVAMLTSASSASALPVWEVNTRWGDQHLKPGGLGEFIVGTRNIGDSANELGQPVTVRFNLPPGVTRVPPLPGDPADAEGIGWDCSGSTEVVCTTFSVIGAFDENRSFSRGGGPYIFIEVAIDPTASGTHTVNTSMEGGGFAIGGTDTDQVTISSQPAGFGIVPGSFQAGTYDGPRPFGMPTEQAGSHPYELRVDFEFNLKRGELPPQGPGRSTEGYTVPDEHIRTVGQTLPRGFVGNPEATPKCKPKDFLDVPPVGPMTGCPPNTQVGYLDLQVSDSNKDHGFGLFFVANTGFFLRIPVYNLEPPKGVPADFGFHASQADGHIYPALDPGQDYAIKANVPYTTDLAPVRHAKLTMWGVPGDPAHDRFRANPNDDEFFGMPYTAPIRPLLTLSSECGVKRDFLLRVDSWTRPEFFTPTITADRSMEVTGCDDPRFRFEPKVDLAPTNRDAGAPTGLQVDMRVPQRNDIVANANELYSANKDPQGIATPPMKKAVVTFPEGMTISTSAAQGLGNCSPEQLGLGTNNPVTCPQNSEYGMLTLETPILPEGQPMTGRIYIAEQNRNPFNNFLSLYLVVQEPERGLLVKIPGKVDLDPVAGQITTTFDDLPQFPVSNMQLKFTGGVRAALVNPSTCGVKTIRGEFTPWNAPNEPVVTNSSFTITKRPDGSPCVNSLGDRPFKPGLTAGTESSSAGSYSPFAFRVTRSDDDQEFSQLDVNLPKGLLANISGIAKCSDAAIRAAEAGGRSGADERDNPSCPASSLIGSTDVGSGVGQVLTYIPGKAYLGGPYKGAPLSMVVITPILAGPYDLGVITVRSKIEVNPETTRASVFTDPFPQIFKGIPVRIRDIRVKVDRKNTIVNPTSCLPMSIDSRITGTGGDVNTTADDTGAQLSDRFQASDCASLPFKPNLSFKLKGGTNRGDYPAFTATLRGRPGDANIAKSIVTLPHSEFLAQEHIRTV